MSPVVFRRHTGLGIFGHSWFCSPNFLPLGTVTYSLAQINVSVPFPVSEARVPPSDKSGVPPLP